MVLLILSSFSTVKSGRCPKQPVLCKLKGPLPMSVVELLPMREHTFATRWSAKRLHTRCRRSDAQWPRGKRASFLGWLSFNGGSVPIKITGRNPPVANRGHVKRRVRSRRLEFEQEAAWQFSPCAFSQGRSTHLRPKARGTCVRIASP